MWRMTSELLVTVEEAARRLNVGRSTVYGLLQRGELASIRIGAARRVLVTALDEFVLTKREAQGAS